LTVVSAEKEGFIAELSTETQRSIAAENLNGAAHIEAAMVMGDRFDGHIVQGHIDFIGKIAAIERRGESRDFYVALPSEAMPLIAAKGSIAIDGVSLTVSELFADSLRLTLIAHTLKNTLFGGYETNRRVNVETDLFARYTARILGARRQTPPASWREVDRLMASF
jgi:riboflavin synthase